MITFDLVSAKNAVGGFTQKHQWIKTKKCTLPKTLESIASQTRKALPFCLYEDGKSSEGPDFEHSSNKKPKSGAVKAMIYPTKFMSNSYLAWDLEFTLNTGIQVGAYSGDIIDTDEAKGYAKKFVSKFMSMEGGLWIDDGGLSQAIKSSSEGQKLMTDISTAFKEKMLLHHGDISKCKLPKESISKPSFSWSSSPTLKILVGGTQELSATVSYLTYDICESTWTSRIDIEIKDDFGVTESDITNASPSAKLGIGGLLDMWVLQKQRGQMPFTSVFNFSFICTGDY